MHKEKNVVYFTNAFVIALLMFYFILCFIGYQLCNINKSINELNVSIHQPMTVVNQQNVKAVNMRITGYLPTGNKTALMEDVKVGWTAAVSPNCIEFLGSRVYIKGHGVRYINDLTHPRLDEEFNMCTLDIAVPTKEAAMSIGNSVNTVVRLNNANITN